MTETKKTQPSTTYSLSLEEKGTNKYHVTLVETEKPRKTFKPLKFSLYPK